MKTTRDMSSRHEDHLASVLNGRKTKGSGSHWSDQTDGKQAYGSGEWVYSWDGKSTGASSISISRAMWDKIIEQAHWAKPLIPIRFYLNARLTESLDLVVCSLDDFAEMQCAANEAAALRRAGGSP